MRYIFSLILTLALALPSPAVALNWSDFFTSGSGTSPSPVADAWYPTVLESNATIFVANATKPPGDGVQRYGSIPDFGKVWNGTEENGYSSFGLDWAGTYTWSGDDLNTDSGWMESGGGITRYYYPTLGSNNAGQAMNGAFRYNESPEFYYAQLRNNTVGYVGSIWTWTRGGAVTGWYIRHNSNRTTDMYFQNMQNPIGGARESFVCNSTDSASMPDGPKLFSNSTPYWLVWGSIPENNQTIRVGIYQDSGDALTTFPSLWSDMDYYFQCDTQGEYLMSDPTLSWSTTWVDSQYSDWKIEVFSQEGLQ